MKRYSFRDESGARAEAAEDSQGDYYSVYEVDQHLNQALNTSADLRKDITELASQLHGVVEQYEKLLFDYETLAAQTAQLPKCGLVCPKK